MKPLSDVIWGESQAQFKKRVEAFYAYQFKPGEDWTLFGDLLIVAHPDRAPILVRHGGDVEEIKPTDWCPLDAPTNSITT